MAHTECHLLGGLFAEGVQLALGVVAVASLVGKRLLEKPRRPWNVWCLDVCKQVASALFAHLLNILAAYWLSDALHVDDQVRSGRCVVVWALSKLSACFSVCLVLHQLYAGHNDWRGTIVGAAAIAGKTCFPLWMEAGARKR